MQYKSIMSLVLLASLAGCATLPTSGPTGRQIEKSALDPEAKLPIQLVRLATVADVPAPGSAMSIDSPSAELVPPPTDMIGPGDILDINIYEAGVTLFASGGIAAAAEKGLPMTANAGVQAQKLPPTRVTDDGSISIPYAGRLHVAGRTVGEVEEMIRHSLQRLSQAPEVVITLSQVITNSVIVSGEVARPGRLVLQTNRETLSDVVALAGGYRGNARDLNLRIVRRSGTIEVRLDELASRPQLDVRALPGDRMMLINAPRAFSVLGASGRVDQLPFSRPTTSLAEAIAAAGGVNPNYGDPGAIFVFRYVQDSTGGEVPIVYHLNMMDSGAYFIAQRFAMRDSDVLYFGNAAANQPSKLFQLVSQLFTPFLTVTAAVQTVQNN